MNIFYLDKDPATCAQYHNDKHCVKMILEYAQLMSTAHRVLDGELVGKTYVHPDESMDEMLYRATHKNHPSAIWARASRENYDWLYSLWIALMDEYTYRYDKVHASARLKPYLIDAPGNIGSGKFTAPTPAMPNDYKIDNDVVVSYHNYYNGSKQHLFSWKNRPVPYFIQEV